MIYVHADWSKVPQAVKNGLAEAAAQLDAIADPQQRKQFIKDNAPKRAALREHLATMSHGKCWYSEASERVSRYQVDHFRPHGRAKQAEKDFADGYSWMAFDLANFRLAGMLCNVANQEYSEETVGKADWFPLRDPGLRATLVARDCAPESPLLLDPIDPDDPPKLDFNDNGEVLPADGLGALEVGGVQLAIRCLGLYQSQLTDARRRKWRECNGKITKYNRLAKRPKGNRTIDDEVTLRELRNELIAMTRSQSEFAAVARRCLAAHKLEQLVVRDELTALGEGA